MSWLQRAVDKAVFEWWGLPLFILLFVLAVAGASFVLVEGLMLIAPGP